MMPTASRAVVFCLNTNDEIACAYLRRRWPLFDDLEPRWQRAGAQQDGKVVCGLHREIAGDLALAAEDRLANDRSRDDLVVEHDGERPPHILQRCLSEPARARIVEPEIHDRFAGARVEARPRIDDVTARNDDALLDDVRLLALFLRTVEDFRHRRRPRSKRLPCRYRPVHQPEIELAGLGHKFDQTLDVIGSRYLDKNLGAGLPA